MKLSYKNLKLAFSHVISNIFFDLGILIKSVKLIQMANKFDEKNIRALDWLSKYPDHLKQFTGLLFSSLHHLMMNKPEILYSHRLYFDFFLFSAQLYKKSIAQLGQDLCVLFFSQKRHEGYFIEIGTGDGKNISNTYLLEKEFGWSGVLVEPNPVFHSSIRKIRENSILIDRPVFNQSGKLVNFICVENSPELSTISDFEKSSDHNRSKFNTIIVETISFRDLLLETHAPHHIDYISIDTEGSEYQILQDFDFEKYTVDIFTIEHNYNVEKLEKMRTLLLKQGYIQVLEEISQFDAWFVRKELIVNFSLDMHKRDAQS